MMNHQRHSFRTKLHRKKVDDITQEKRFMIVNLIMIHVWFGTREDGEGNGWYYDEYINTDSQAQQQPNKHFFTHKTPPL